MPFLRLVAKQSDGLGVDDEAIREQDDVPQEERGFDEAGLEELYSRSGDLRRALCELQYDYHRRRKTDVAERRDSSQSIPSLTAVFQEAEARSFADAEVGRRAFMELEVNALPIFFLLEGNADSNS